MVDLPYGDKMQSFRARDGEIITVYYRFNENNTQVIREDGSVLITGGGDRFEDYSEKWANQGYAPAGEPEGGEPEGGEPGGGEPGGGEPEGGEPGGGEPEGG